MNAHKYAAKTAWRKPISQARDKLQGDLLTGLLGTLLFAKAALQIFDLYQQAPLPQWFWIACGISVTFAVITWMLRAATAPAAAMGALVCLHVLLRQERDGAFQNTAIVSLLTLFLLTFAATKFGRSRKEAMGIAEPRRGRCASQVLANLGVAALLASSGTASINPSALLVSKALFAASIAALAEATADTVSSEIGQALAGTGFGRKTVLVTTGRSVPAGTDGGISMTGTVAGAAAAAVVVLLSPIAHTPAIALIVFAAACIGLIFDSLLGATLEHFGWIGNDLVNLLSTLCSALVAFAAVRLL